MSRCLSDTRIRAVADDEATELERGHVETCAECQARLRVAHRANDELTAIATSVAVPASLRAGVARAVTGRDRAGATTLRDMAAPPWRSPLWLTAGAVAAAVAAVVFVLPPLDAPRALSAAEILDRSLQTLSPATGTELRDFDLELQLPRMASMQNGKYRIEQLLDHETPGRYRIVRYASNGELLDAISEEPATGTRTVIMRVDGQPVAFRFTIERAHAAPLRDLERHHVEAMIRVLQAAAGQSVHEVDVAGGKRYVVELPHVTDAGASGLWELGRARVVVDASDFQILELTAAGSYMGESFSVSFRLRSRHVRPSAEVTPDQFELPSDAAVVTIEGAGTEDVGHDVLVTALRELVRSKQ